ncbi:unnamed protein product [Symbiodinium microadriaticum]|nr:unnamed protein product [Symbiodinium microadriaticum]
MPRQPPVVMQTVTLKVEVEHQVHAFAEVYTKETEVTYSRNFFEAYHSRNCSAKGGMEWFGLFRLGGSLVSQTINRNVCEAEQFTKTECVKKQLFHPGTEQIFRLVSIEMQIQNKGAPSAFCMTEKECVKSGTQVQNVTEEDLLERSKEHMKLLTGDCGKVVGRAAVMFADTQQRRVELAEEFAQRLMSLGVPADRLSKCLARWDTVPCPLKWSKDSLVHRAEDPRVERVRAGLRAEGLYEDGLEYEYELRGPLGTA